MRKTALVILAAAALGVANASSPTDYPLNTVTLESGGTPNYTTVEYERYVGRYALLDVYASNSVTFDDAQAEWFTLTPRLTAEQGNDAFYVFVELSVPEGIIPFFGENDTWVRTGVSYSW